jgi:hypothetical protein
MTVKTLSSEEAGTHLRDVIDAVTTGEAEVVIERHGTPSVVDTNYCSQFLSRETRQLKYITTLNTKARNENTKPNRQAT